MNMNRICLRIFRKGRESMLTVKEAKKIGIRACIDAIGYEFCKKHADNGTSLYGDEDGKVYCYVGVSDEPAPECDISKVDRLVLTSGEDWPYYACCHVYRKDGRIEMLEVKKPD